MGIMRPIPSQSARKPLPAAGASFHNQLKRYSFYSLLKKAIAFAPHTGQTSGGSLSQV